MDLSCLCCSKSHTNKPWRMYSMNRTHAGIQCMILHAADRSVTKIDCIQATKASMTRTEDRSHSTMLTGSLEGGVNRQPFDLRQDLHPLHPLSSLLMCMQYFQQTLLRPESCTHSPGGNIDPRPAGAEMDQSCFYTVAQSEASADCFSN